jgi:tellurite methyltransferase
MKENELTQKLYDQKYGGKSFYWTTRPSTTCFEVLRRMPPERPLKLLEIGCGEGRNAVFFARNGYEVHAFDLSEKGVEKTKRFADQAQVVVHVFRADLNIFRLTQTYDILFSTGTLHSSHPSIREELFDNYKAFTAEGGLNVFSVFVRKPFIGPAPDADPNSHLWRSGELFTIYHDWQIEWCVEEIFDDSSGGIPHKHAVNRLIARKPTSQELPAVDEFPASAP